MNKNKIYIAQVPIFVAGIISILGALYFRLNSNYDGELEVSELLIVSLIWVLACFYLWWRSRQTQRDLPLLPMLVVAITLRVMALGASPILEDDG